MSLQTFIAGVETKIEQAVTWVEGETDTALTAVWNAAEPLFIAFEPTLIQDTLGGIETFLTNAEADVKNGELGDIEQAFIENLETTGSALLTDIKTLSSSAGSSLLQVLIGLVKTKLG
jgi:hypothetical protein